MDAATLDAKERARLWKQALDWLSADLTAWTWLLDKGPSLIRPVIPQRLTNWQKDTDLAGVCDKAALEKLPPDERKQWQKLWADVEALRKRAAQVGGKN